MKNGSLTSTKVGPFQQKGFKTMSLRVALFQVLRESEKHVVEPVAQLDCDAELRKNVGLYGC